ncbi:MAG: hypothetical protein MJ070_05140 [Lachnospiraceae bacterium]|nr:hypothetical protein [Lachnospiraceae bacterium]
MKTFFLVCLYIFLAVIVVGIAGRLLRKTEKGRGTFLGRRDQILKMASLSSLDRTTVWFATFRLSDGSEIDLKTSEQLSGSFHEGREYDLTWKGMILKTAIPVKPEDEEEPEVPEEDGADGEV